ncbi:MAG: NAD(P)H-hydrate dehydratase [Acidobacteriaceae bacterium]
MRILTAEEMRSTDQRTTEQHNVPSLDLMEQAGAAVARFVLRHFAERQRVAVICGKGNNGGDGFVTARHLASAGKKVSVLLLAQPAVLRGDAAVMYVRLLDEQPGVLVQFASDEDALAAGAVQAFFAGSDLFVDAVLGTGFQPPLRGMAIAVRDKLAALTTPVVAVDLPSGWDADADAMDCEGAFRADAVVTFTAPKLAHMFGHLTRGPVVVAPIGSPEEAIQSATQLTWTGASRQICAQPRAADANKGRFGHVLLVGGARGKAGAPAMSSMAAMRAGAGLVTTAVPESILPTVAAFAPEMMTEPLAETAQGSIALRNLEADVLQRLLERKTVLAIGPGLSREEEAASFVRALVQRTTLPVVLDADALNAFEGQTDQLNSDGRTLVLTPHPGEMSRLTGKSVKEIEADRVKIAREFAQQHGVTLVLKGWRTLVAHPDGMVAVNTTGNPAMAKGGSGDILTGIIAALLAQHPEKVADAVNAAVYLHGLAGDFAVRAQDEHTVLATDTLAHLWQAFQYRAEDADELTWLCGLPELAG